MNLGDARLAVGDVGGAIEAYGRAVALAPDEPAAANNLAWALLQDPVRWPEAEPIIERALARRPEPRGYYLDTLGALRMRKGDTQEALDAVIDIDVKGTLLMTHEFGARMLEQGHGSIVQVGSTVIVRGSARAPQYAAAKYAILGITKSYAKAFAPTVRVNTFAPGFMETERLRGREDWKGGRREVLLSQTPMGVIPPPEFVAGTCLWLATDESAHLTGGYLLADGGFNMVGA